MITRFAELLSPDQVVGVHETSLRFWIKWGCRLKKRKGIVKVPFGRGTLIQYAGRLHRLHYLKKEVLVYDYVDFDIPVLNRMFEKRRRGYRSIGYEIEET
jgi:superfamily II DNA or RNA helicase